MYIYLYIYICISCDIYLIYMYIVTMNTHIYIYIYTLYCCTLYTYTCYYARQRFSEKICEIVLVSNSKNNIMNRHQLTNGPTQGANSSLCWIVSHIYIYMIIYVYIHKSGRYCIYQIYNTLSYTVHIRVRSCEPLSRMHMQVSSNMYILPEHSTYTERSIWKVGSKSPLHSRIVRLRLSAVSFKF